MPDSNIYYGIDTADYEPLSLKAGPLTLLYNDGYIRSIKFGEHEVVRRVYMALRDRFWNTVLPEINPVLISIDDSFFHISFEALHKKDDIHFKWLGEIKGEANGTIKFSMRGEALSTFHRNRIGFCVLHPLQLCAGRACTIETADGNKHEETFPVFISPTQPFINLSSISYKIPSQAGITIGFEGDIFEMEDQRNWTDASFKTYSTPHSLPIPVKVEKGDVIEQVITIMVEFKDFPEVITPKPVEIKIGAGQKHNRTVPQVGVSFAGMPLTPFAAEMLQALSLSHLRTDIVCDSNSIIKDMEEHAGLCNLLGLPAELALHLTSDFLAELLFIVQVLRTTQIPVRRFLIYRKDMAVTPPQTIEAAYLALHSYAPQAQIGAGTNSHFAEINKDHPSTEHLDLICYSASPQIHTFDSISVMENLPGIAETLRTASLFQGKSHPAITPITLRPRKNLQKPEKAGGADPRQSGLFCAAWTLGNLMYCIDGAAATLTYYETTGPAGLMPAQEQSVFPVYHVLASIQELTGASAQNCICSDFSKIASIAVTKGVSMVLLLANLTDSPQQVTIFDLPESVNFLSLDETTFEEATRHPRQWKCKKGDTRNATGPFHVFDILPYGILRIDAPII